MKPSVYQYLDSFINYELYLNNVSAEKFDLERIRHVLKLTGNPQKNLKIIHIAGSKGKGSTAAFVAEGLKACGYKTGLYTSPHLLDLKERFRILDAGRHGGDGVYPDTITDGELYDVVGELKPFLEAAREDPRYGALTYFEVLTVVAFLFFDRQKVDFAVMETGLGGRLDATNVADALVSVITPIGLEHMKQLGPTIEAIAAEKAAIIKRGTQAAVSGVQDPAADDVIREQCARTGVPLFRVGDDITVESCPMTKEGMTVGLSGKEEYSLTSRSFGRHQAENIAAALLVREQLQAQGFAVDSSKFLKGIGNTVVPGRFEIIRKDPAVILDAAHTKESVRALADTLKEMYPGKRFYMIAGCSSDKDYGTILGLLSGIAQEIVFTTYDHPRAADIPEEKLKTAVPDIPIHKAGSFREGLDKILSKTGENDIILITGSIFLVAEAKRVIQGELR